MTERKTAVLNINWTCFGYEITSSKIIDDYAKPRAPHVIEFLKKSRVHLEDTQCIVSQKARIKDVERMIIENTKTTFIKIKKITLYSKNVVNVT